jgi:hypothetical protein
MNNYNWLILTLLLIFVLTSCTETAATPSQEELVQLAYTSAAMTISAGEATANPTSTFLPTPTIQIATMMPTSMIQPISLISTPTKQVLSSAVGCDNSVYISDVTIPDGTVFTPGSTFTKTWNMQNTGSCAWTTSYSMVYYSGSLMSGTATALNDEISAGSTSDVSVELVAPSTAGTYTGYWRMQNASGTSFGEIVYVQIVVSGSTSTPTATEEDEATSTPTATSEPTTEPTSTPEPTATEASVETVTE